MDDLRVRPVKPGHANGSLFGHHHAAIKRKLRVLVVKERLQVTSLTQLSYNGHLSWMGASAHEEENVGMVQTAARPNVSPSSCSSETKGDNGRFDAPAKLNFLAELLQGALIQVLLKELLDSHTQTSAFSFVNVSKATTTNLLDVRDLRRVDIYPQRGLVDALPSQMQPCLTRRSKVVAVKLYLTRVARNAPTRLGDDAVVRHQLRGERESGSLGIRDFPEGPSRLSFLVGKTPR